MILRRHCITTGQNVSDLPPVNHKSVTIESQKTLCNILTFTYNGCHLV